MHTCLQCLPGPDPRLLPLPVTVQLLTKLQNWHMTKAVLVEIMQPQATWRGLGDQPRPLPRRQQCISRHTCTARLAAGCHTVRGCPTLVAARTQSPEPPAHVRFQPRASAAWYSFSRQPLPPARSLCRHPRRRRKSPCRPTLSAFHQHLRLLTPHAPSSAGPPAPGLGRRGRRGPRAARRRGRSRRRRRAAGHA